MQLVDVIVVSDVVCSFLVFIIWMYVQVIGRIEVDLYGVDDIGQFLGSLGVKG